MDELFSGFGHSSKKNDKSPERQNKGQVDKGGHGTYMRKIRLV